MNSASYCRLNFPNLRIHCLGWNLFETASFSFKIMRKAFKIFNSMQMQDSFGCRIIYLNFFSCLFIKFKFKNWLILSISLKKISYLIIYFFLSMGFFNIFAEVILKKVFASLFLSFFDIFYKFILINFEKKRILSKF